MSVEELMIQQVIYSHCVIGDLMSRMEQLKAHELSSVNMSFHGDSRQPRLVVIKLAA